MGGLFAMIYERVDESKRLKARTQKLFHKWSGCDRFGEYS